MKKMDKNDKASLVGIIVAALAAASVEKYGFNWFLTTVLILGLAAAILFQAVPDFRAAKKAKQDSQASRILRQAGFNMPRTGGQT